MTTHNVELRDSTIARLDTAGVPRNWYAFDAATEDNQFVCRKATVGFLRKREVWRVAHYERRSYGPPTDFTSEAEAYEQLVTTLTTLVEKIRTSH